MTHYKFEATDSVDERLKRFLDCYPSENLDKLINIAIDDYFNSLQESAPKQSAEQIALLQRLGALEQQGIVHNNALRNHEARINVIESQSGQSVGASPSDTGSDEAARMAVQDG